MTELAEIRLGPGPQTTNLPNTPNLPNLPNLRRVTVSLACGECETRNYRTTRKVSHKGQLELKKFCPVCRRHTIHKETK